MSETTRTLDRRGFLAFALALGGGAVFACSSPEESSTEGDGKAKTPPTDDGEFRPGQSDPVQATSTKLPNASWEGRARQLEALSPVYTEANPGPWAGKERSHVPQATVNGSKVLVVVQHVMGTNGLDGGTTTTTTQTVVADAPQTFDQTALPGGGPKKNRDAGTPPPTTTTDAGAAKDGGATTTTAPTGVHYITTIYLKGDNGLVVGLWEFSSTAAAPPTVEFTVPPGVTSVTAYEYCTVHGLWASGSMKIG